MTAQGVESARQDEARAVSFVGKHDESDRRVAQAIRGQGARFEGREMLRDAVA